MEMNSKIEKVLIIGSGNMAQHIGLQCALFGKEIVMSDPFRFKQDKDSIETVKLQIHKILEKLINDQMISEEKAKETEARFTYEGDPKEACKGVDLVSESVLEDVQIKAGVWSAFAPYIPQTAILTTNTSSLFPSDFADATGAPKRFLAWHFHLPVFYQNLADIMPHPGTNPEVVRRMELFSAEIHENSVVINKEWGGYLANNMLFAVLNTALQLYLDGVASVEAIDKAWMGVRIANAGPFGLIDKIGLDVTLDILPHTEHWEKIEKLLTDMIEKGQLGVKTGKGFYNYPNPPFEEKEFIIRAGSIQG